MEIFTFTIQYICNLWWIENSPSETIPWQGAPKTRSKLTGEHLTQKHDSSKAAAMYLYWNHTYSQVLVSSLFIFSNKMLMSLCEKKRFVSSTYMIGFGTLQAWCNHLHIMGTVKVQRWILEEHRMLWSFFNRIIFKRNKIVFGSSNSFQTILDYSKELS